VERNSEGVDCKYLTLPGKMWFRSLNLCAMSNANHEFSSPLYPKYSSATLRAFLSPITQLLQVRNDGKCCIMSALNLSGSHPAFFILVGIPGMEKSHTWISIPVCMMYCAALFGNLVLLVTIMKERSLHEPMYIFLCMLAVCDLLLSTATVPKTLSVLWSLSQNSRGWKGPLWVI